MNEFDILGQHYELSYGGINFVAVFIGVLFGFVSALVLIVLYKRLNNKAVVVEKPGQIGMSKKVNDSNINSAGTHDADDGQGINAEQIDLHVSTGSARDLRSRFALRRNSDLSQSSKSQRATIDMSQDESDDYYADAPSPAGPLLDANAYYRRITVGRSAAKNAYRSPNRRHPPAGLDTYEAVRNAYPDAPVARGDEVHEVASDDSKELDKLTEVYDPSFFNYGDGVDSPLHASSNSVQSSSFGLHSRSGKALLSASNKSKSKQNVFQ